MALQKHPLRNIFLGHRGAIESGLLSGQTYAQKVLSYGPIAYWPMWEAAGLTAECLVNSPAQDGTYTGVTLGQPGIGDGNTSPLFDGINDFVNIFTATFDAAFNGSEGTVIIWGLQNAWDSNLNAYLWSLRDDNNNRYHSKKETAPPGANDMRPYGLAGGAGGAINSAAVTGSAIFNHFTFTWSDTANELELLINGASEGVRALPNAWTGGGLDNTNTTIGSSDTAPGGPWNGYLAHCAVFDRVLPPAAILDLATV